MRRDRSVLIGKKETPQPVALRLLGAIPGMASLGEEYPDDTLKFMRLAMEQANEALDSLEVPVGCVIVEDGKVIASGRNRTNETRNATRHAEMEAIDTLLEQWREQRLSKSQVAEKFSKCRLYVTCEPCIMCASALSFIGMPLFLWELLLALQNSHSTLQTFYI
ncbi:unnamed protein product [Malus baccata var. baccata]